MAMLKSWKYDECSYKNSGVDLYDDHITRWESENWVSPFAGGGASDQTYDEFLKNGSWVEGVPAEIVAELREMVVQRTQK